MPTVVPRARRAVRRSSASVESPSLSAASASESSTPWEKSSGVDGALAVTMRPSPSTTTQSVKVPPVSIPQMKSPVVATLFSSWREILPASTCDGARGSPAASASCSAAPVPSAIHVLPAHGRGQRNEAPLPERALRRRRVPRRPPHGSSSSARARRGPTRIAPKSRRSVVRTRYTCRRSATAMTVPSTSPNFSFLNLASSSSARTTSDGSGSSYSYRVPGSKISATSFRMAGRFSRRK